MRLLESLIVDTLLDEVADYILLFLLDSVVFSIEHIKLVADIFIIMLKISNLFF